MNEMNTVQPGHCPRCNSPAPHLHPAVQWEGEVHICPHEYHATAEQVARVASGQHVVEGV